LNTFNIAVLLFYKSGEIRNFAGAGFRPDFEKRPDFGRSRIRNRIPVQPYKAPIRSSLSTNQHSAFLQGRCPSCCPTNSFRALKDKLSHFTDLLTASSPGGFCILVLTPKASGRHGGSVASACSQYLQKVSQSVANMDTDIC